MSLLDEAISGSDWETLQRLDGLFALYHKQWWCRLQMFYRFKKLNALFNGVALLIMALSMVVGSVWKESLAMVGLTALATLVKGWSDFKKYSFKMDMCRFAYTIYEKTLIELRNHAQTGVDEYQMNSFLIKMQTIDDTVTDITPPTRESYVGDYTKTFRHKTIKQKHTRVSRSVYTEEPTNHAQKENTA